MASFDLSPLTSALSSYLERLCRKALHEFHMISEQDQALGIALSGGKDSLTLLILLSAISGKGFPPFKLHAFHVTGSFSCGPGVTLSMIQTLCTSLGVPLHVLQSHQKLETLECYSCSRERRKLLFEAAKKEGISTIAFGHHRDDTVQTLLMNLLHKAEFATQLPKIHMRAYDMTIIRPLIFIPEEKIIEFAKQRNLTRVVCQCPVGQDSLRQKTKELLKTIQEIYPNSMKNLFLAAQNYGSSKAQKEPSKENNKPSAHFLD